MSEIKYLKQLSNLEKEKLLTLIGFDKELGVLEKTYSSLSQIGELKEFESTFNDGGYNTTKSVDILHFEKPFTPLDLDGETRKLFTGNRTYLSATLNDYYIFSMGVGTNTDEPVKSIFKKLHQFMYEKFGEEYLKDCKVYLEKSKQRRKSYLDEKFSSLNSQVDELTK